MPTPNVLSAITDMQSEKVLAYHFWYCTFQNMNMSYRFSHRFWLQSYTDIDCDGHEIALVAFWSSEQHLGLISKNETD